MHLIVKFGKEFNVSIVRGCLLQMESPGNNVQISVALKNKHPLIQKQNRELQSFKMSCANHICKNPSLAHFACSLCKKAVYCSSECRTLDWVKHDCPNVIPIAKKETGLFMPYYFEDRALEGEHKDVPEQSFKTIHFGGDNKVTEKLYHVGGPAQAWQDDKPELETGAEPTSVLKERSPWFKLSFGTASQNQMYEFEGNIPYDMIYKGNKANKKAAALLGGGTFKQDKETKAGGFLAKASGVKRRLRVDPNKYVFWIDSEKIIDQNIQIPLVDVAYIYWRCPSTPEMHYTFISGAYALKAGEKPTLSKKLKVFYNAQLRTKLGGRVDPNNVVTLKAVDKMTGIEATFSLLTVSGSAFATLVDIEFMLPKLAAEAGGLRTPSPLDMAAKTVPPLKDEESPLPPVPAGYAVAETKVYRFECDPRKTEHMAGLSMTLEKLIASELAMNPDIHDEAFEKLEKDAAQIRNYARNMLENGPPEEVPTSINTLVRSISAQLYDAGKADIVLQNERTLASMLRDQRQVERFKNMPDEQKKIVLTQLKGPAAMYCAKLIKQ